MNRELADEHRRRRRSAYLRSASVHERAAEVHTAAVAFFLAHGDVDRATTHRRQADLQMRAAIHDWNEAELQ